MTHRVGIPYEESMHCESDQVVCPGNEILGWGAVISSWISLLFRRKGQNGRCYFTVLRIDEIPGAMSQFLF
jgi:hypothetical protein